jgi:tRNA threonylcarbamoyladenosine biosynthesis protein TsaB
MTPCILAIESATGQCSVALLRGAQGWQRAVTDSSQHSQAVLPLVAQVLDDANCPRSALTYIAAGIGPGAFTGVRTAISVAQGLALGLGVPLIGVGSLEALALAGGVQAPTRVACMLDARMHEVYAAVFDVDPLACAVQTVAAPAVMPPAQLPAWLPAGVTLGIGNAFEVYSTQCAALPFKCITAVPQARDVARLAQQRAAKQASWPVQACQPLYVRDRVALTQQEQQVQQAQQVQQSQRQRAA